MRSHQRKLRFFNQAVAIVGLTLNLIPGIPRVASVPVSLFGVYLAFREE